jgi:uroporphyrinogen-III synthase
VYFRSDRAGTGLGRALRRRGHRVEDVVCYRTRPARTLTARTKSRLLDASIWIATSPSSLDLVVRSLAPPDLRRVRHNVRLVVLGARSEHAARRRGFRRTTVAPATTAQRFTRHLLSVHRDAVA